VDESQAVCRLLQTTDDGIDVIRIRSACGNGTADGIVEDPRAGSVPPRTLGRASAVACAGEPVPDSGVLPKMGSGFAAGRVDDFFSVESGEVHGLVELATHMRQQCGSCLDDRVAIEERDPDSQGP